MVTIETSGVAVVDWGWRDKVGGWSPLKKGIIETLVNFGFEEKKIVFVSQNQKRNLAVDDYMINIGPPLRPTALSIAKVFEIQNDLAVGRPIAELDIVRAPF